MIQTPLPHIPTLWRYPVKGLSAQEMSRVQLSAGMGIPGDRRFALAYSSAEINPAAPHEVLREHLITLASHPSLALLITRWIEVAQTLTIERKRRQVGRANLSSPLGKVMLAEFFAAYLKQEVRGTPHVLEAPPSLMFTDQPAPVVKIISRSSLAEVERVAGQPLDPRRFRANVLLEGGEPWDEFGWIGGVLRLGEARLRITGRIEQTASAGVEPETGKTDTSVMKILQKGYGHADFGVYGQVIAGGLVQEGDRWELEDLR